MTSRTYAEHPPLIEEPLFHKVQTLRRDLSHPTTRSRQFSLLKGLIRCGDCGSYMTPHYTQKRRKDGSVSRIGYYRCTKTVHFNNGLCRIKHVNARHTEGLVINYLTELSHNDAYVEMSLDELNWDNRQKLVPLQKEAAELKKSIEIAESEIRRYVKALGQGKISIHRLEKELEQREADKQALQVQYDDLMRKINEESACGYNAELVKQNLRDFQKVFSALTSQEQAEALQCLVKDVVVYPDKLELNVFELAEFCNGSQKSKGWWSQRDSNPCYRRERPVS